jgi:RNA polymerase sigma factor (sigma-70 family)
MPDQDKGGLGKPFAPVSAVILLLAAEGSVRATRWLTPRRWRLAIPAGSVRTRETRPGLPGRPGVATPLALGARTIGGVTEVDIEYAAFFRDEFPSVLRTITLMLRDQPRAEEITQDAFIQLLLGWPKISRYERPGAWVRRVAVRLAMRSIRRDRLWARVREGLLPSAPARSSRFDVDGAIRRLPASQRAAIVLHYYEDRPLAEVAMILGCAETTARVHLHHGRNRMRELLGEDDYVA